MNHFSKPITLTITDPAPTRKAAFVTCERCGAAVLIDLHGATDAVGLHDAFHDRVTEQFRLLLERKP